MDKKEYITIIENSLLKTLEDPKLSNYKKQLFAKLLGAEFNITYKEEYLWQKALLLSNNATILINSEYFNNYALKAFKECGEIYEYLGENSSYDKDYCKILSALCYDIAGYQANAYCMMKGLGDYYYKNEFLIDYEIEVDNLILFNIQQFLLRRIPYAFNYNKKYEDSSNLAINLFLESIQNLYQNILYGQEKDFVKNLHDTYLFFLNNGNVHLSHLLSLFEIRILKYLKRSIWLNIGKENKTKSTVWNKYIKILSNDIYSNYRVKELKSRTSRYEFWVSQLAALKKGILSSDDSFIIQMPTSSGKTFIAELAIIDSLVKEPDKKCLYIAPFRALARSIEEELAKSITKLGFSVSTLSGNYEADEYEDFFLKVTDILVATPEKLDFLFRLYPNFFENISLLIIDEGHIIGDISERSSILEFLIIKLRRRIKNLKILFISAVLPETNTIELSEWISNKKENVISSPKYIDGQEWHPTRKIIGKFQWSGDRGRIDYPNIELGSEEVNILLNNNYAFVPSIILKEKKEIINPKTKRPNLKIFPHPNRLRADTAAMLGYKLSDRGSSLIFCSQPRFTESVGKSFLDLVEFYKLTNMDISTFFSENEDKESYYLSKLWIGEDSVLTQCIKIGVGIHYSALPEPVRRAVENDFIDGKLRILISTTTIGQGLNFPIKNLIIHSLFINPQIKQAVTVRDFWNLVGRTGRACIETEGNIVFLTLNSSDNLNFEKYTNKKEIESVKSIFTRLLDGLLENRITQEVFQNNLNILAEPNILNILIEESVGTNDEKLIEEIINLSLFKIQSVNIEPLKEGFRKIFSTIRKEVSSEKIKIFSKTALSLKSNKIMNEFVLSKLDDLKEIIQNEDYYKFLEYLVIILRDSNIHEMNLKRTRNYNSIKDIALCNFLQKWIEGTNIQELDILWKEINEVKSNKLNDYIGEALYYKYPWGITAFLVILASELGIDYDELPGKIKDLSTFIKFGLNDIFACFSMSLGIKSRETALKLKRQYKDASKFYDFLSWLSNISYDDISIWEEELNEYDKNNIIEVALKLNLNKYIKDQPIIFEFDIKGIFYSAIRKETSKKIKKGCILEYKRDFDNKYDPFAIELFYNGYTLGFVPREYAKILSTEIDLNQKKYVVKVKDIIDNIDYKDVKVEMSQIF